MQFAITAGSKIRAVIERIIYQFKTNKQMKTNRLLNKSIRLLFYCLLAFVLISCTHVEVEEYNSINSYCDNTWFVGSKVWVRNWRNKPISLELWKQECVPFEKIDSVRALQRIEVVEYVYKVEQCLKHDRLL